MYIHTYIHTYTHMCVCVYRRGLIQPLAAAAHGIDAFGL